MEGANGKFKCLSRAANFLRSLKLKRPGLVGTNSSCQPEFAISNFVIQVLPNSFLIIQTSTLDSRRRMTGLTAPDGDLTSQER